MNKRTHIIMNTVAPSQEMHMTVGAGPIKLSIFPARHNKII